jgi:hypothetical protein
LIYGEKQLNDYKVELAHKLAVSRNENKKMKKQYESKIQDLHTQLAEQEKKESLLRNELSH